MCSQRPEINCAAKLSCSSRCCAGSLCDLCIGAAREKIPVGDSSARFEHLQFWSQRSAQCTTEHLSVVNQPESISALTMDLFRVWQPWVALWDYKAAEKGERDFSRNSLVLHDKPRTLLQILAEVCKHFKKVLSLNQCQWGILFRILKLLAAGQGSWFGPGMVTWSFFLRGTPGWGIVQQASVGSPQRCTFGSIICWFLCGCCTQDCLCSVITGWHKGTPK